MEHALVLAIIGIALVLFVTEWVRADIVAIGVAVALPLLGLVSVGEAFSGFSNAAVITVIAMFILSAGLVRTGVADWIAAQILRFGGTNPVVLTALIMVSVGLMSAFMNNIGAVAVMMPAMFAIASKSGIPASRLLMPLSFGSLLGGLLTVIGTPPNLLISMALEDHGFQSFRLFDFAPTGVVVMAVGVAYMALVGRHLIPVRDGGGVADAFGLGDYLTEVIVPESSPLVGKQLADSRLREDLGLGAVRLRRGDGDKARWILPFPDTTLQAGDRIVVQGDLSRLLKEKDRGHFEIYAEHQFRPEQLDAGDQALVEVVVPPNSPFVGKAIRDLDIRRRLAILVLAVKHRGRAKATDFSQNPLEGGDVLLVQGEASAVNLLAKGTDFLVVNRVENDPVEHRKAPLAVAILALSLALAAFGWAHISVAAMLGVFVMAITACLKVDEIYAAVDWRVVFLIAGMMPLGIAMDDAHAGTASLLANGLVGTVGPHGPLVVLAALFLFTTLITEVMSNAAAAVLLAPISIAVSNGLGLEPYPFLMAIAIGASTTFLSPIGHQSNVLIYGVGNYRFLDFARAGAPLNALVFAVVLVVVPAVWPFVPLAE